MTFGSYAPGCLKELSLQVSPRTLAIYRDVLRCHLLPRFDAVPLGDITRRDIRLHLQRKRTEHAASTVRLMATVLHRFLAVACDQELIPHNTCAGVTKSLRLGPRRNEHREAMTAEEELAFLDATQHLAPRYLPLFAFLLGTGARISEALAIRWEHFHPSDATAEVMGKGGKYRTLHIPRRLVPLLLESQQLNPPWVFPSRDRRTAAFVMRRVLRSARLPHHYHPHSLRHTYASRMLSAGVSPAYVQRQLGHASIRLTCDLYGRWLPMPRPPEVDNVPVTR